MVVRVIKSWAWESFPLVSKPEWQDISARFKDPEQEVEKEPKKVVRRGRGRGRKKVEKVYEFSSDLKLLELPGEILDLVLGQESLNLRDHLALAATSRSLRACYYTPCEEDSDASSNSRHSVLWSGLLNLRPMPEQAIRYFEEATDEETFAVEHIWTNAPFDPNNIEELGDQMQIVRVLPDDWNLTKKGKPRKYKRRRQEGDDPEGDLGIKSKEWLLALEKVNYYRMTKTQAQSVYKLKSHELDLLYCVCKPNPYGRKTAPPIQCFLEASVESLAFRLHGGAFKHDELVRKRETMAAKARATRERNGTTTGRKRRKSSEGSYTYYGCG
ncbi:hypothetical protein JCM3765_002039 [Sporobolomyces pararoseus]